MKNCWCNKNLCKKFIEREQTGIGERVSESSIQGSNPRRFIIFLQNGGDLCAHRAGGASTIRIVCALHNPLYELPSNSVGGTKFRATTKRGEEAPRLAAKTEK